MLFVIFLLCLSSNFLFIRSEDDNITVNLTHEKNCTLKPTYIFTEDHNVTLHIEWTNKPYTINHVLLRHDDSEIYNFNLSKTDTIVANKSMEGIWIFEFLYLKGVDTNNTVGILHKTYNKDHFTMITCSTNVTIEPAEYLDINNTDHFVIIVITVIVIAVIIIIAQAGFIVYLKAKAKKLNRHNNLSKKTEHSNIDSARYCSDPGKKVVKSAPIIETDRESTIYEAPNIELPDRLPIMQPPNPPAISTIPRKPRPDQHSKLAPQNMSSLNRPGRGPNTEHQNLPRPKPDREINISNRPPLELPPREDKFQEVYEEMEADYNTYEPPPVINTLPSRHNVPPKKTAVQPNPNMQREQPKLRCTTKPGKPGFTPKPQRPPPKAAPAANELEQAFRRRNNDVAPVANELEQAFRRRNNVMHVPIVSIPEPSGSTAPKPRPPPVLKSTKRGPPEPQPVTPEEAYYSYSDGRQGDSSDEEWTYEPLQPMKNYNINNNNENIYNNV